MTTKKRPLAFFSYVREDDRHEGGRLSQFRTQLEGEVRLQWGDRSFAIFQDWKDIAWGQDWQQMINSSLDEVLFLIPVITPGFFRSEPCRDELTRFLEREQRLKRTDLVLPIYYLDCRDLNDPEKRVNDLLTEAVYRHKWEDWRELRFEVLTSPTLSRRIAQMATRIIDAIEQTDFPALQSAGAAVSPNKDDPNVNIILEEALSARPSPNRLSAQRQRRWNSDALQRGSTEWIDALIDWAAHMPPSGYRWREDEFSQLVQSNNPIKGLSL